MIINRVQVLNYGCLHYVDVPLDRFHVFIGPNASGKSTLMDAIKFVSDVVRDGVDAACRVRTANFADLVWGRPQDPKEQRFRDCPGVRPAGRGAGQNAGGKAVQGFPV